MSHFRYFFIFLLDFFLDFRHNLQYNGIWNVVIPQSEKEVIFTNGIFKTECTFIKGIIYTGIRDDDPVRKTDGWRKTSAGT